MRCHILLMTTTRLQTRDRKNGRYAHANLDLLCVCGHSLGEHTAETVGGLRHCLHGTFPDEGHMESCECERFRKSRKKAG